jgi:hypothetical protein
MCSNLFFFLSIHPRIHPSIRPSIFHSDCRNPPKIKKARNLLQKLPKIRTVQKVRFAVVLQKSEKSEKNTTSIPPGPGRLGSLQPVHPCPHDRGRCLSAAPENFGWADGPGSMEPAA